MANIILVLQYFPTATPKRQSTTLATIYAVPNKYLPPSKSVSPSREKVENVVKPPHTPVLKNKTHCFDLFSLEPAIPTTIPIRTAPSRLVNSVRNGKSPFSGIRLIRYRHTAPNAPPSPTNKTFIIIPLRSFYRYHSGSIYHRKVSFALCRHPVRGRQDGGTGRSLLPME